MLALTATVTDLMTKDVISTLDMEGFKIIFLSSDRPNIYYEVKYASDIKTDMTHLISSIQTESVRARREIVYCRTIDMCTDLYIRTLMLTR